MRKEFKIILFCILLCTCSKKNEDIKIRPSVLNLVDSLSISYKSTPNLVFISDDFPNKSYHKFIKITTEEELKTLTHHKTPNIRCYAFNGLVERNFSEVKKIFEEHIKDTAQINLYFGGCIVRQMTVMEFMLDQLHPSGSKSKEKLSRKEYDKYRKMMMEYHQNKTKGLQ